MTHPDVIFTTQDKLTIDRLEFANYGQLPPRRIGPALAPDGELSVEDTGPADPPSPNRSQPPTSNADIELISPENFAQIQQEAPQRQARRLARLKNRRFQQIAPDVFARLLYLVDPPFLHHHLTSFFVSANMTQKVDEQVTRLDQWLRERRSADWNRGVFGWAIPSWNNLPPAAFFNEVPRQPSTSACLYIQDLGTSDMIWDYATTRDQALALINRDYPFYSQAKITLPLPAESASAQVIRLAHAPDWMRANDHLVFYWELVDLLGDTTLPDAVAARSLPDDFAGAMLSTAGPSRYPRWYVTKATALSNRETRSAIGPSAKKNPKGSGMGGRLNPCHALNNEEISPAESSKDSRAQRLKKPTCESFGAREANLDSLVSYPWRVQFSVDLELIDGGWLQITQHHAFASRHQLLELNTGGFLTNSFRRAKGPSSPALMLQRPPDVFIEARDSFFSMPRSFMSQLDEGTLHNKCK